MLKNCIHILFSYVVHLKTVFKKNQAESALKLQYYYTWQAALSKILMSDMLVDGKTRVKGLLKEQKKTATSSRQSL